MITPQAARAVRRFGAVLGSLLLSLSQASGQIIFEDCKIVPDDGAPYARFGFSIAVHSNVVAIGAPTDLGNGTGSGAVYVFDTHTGVQVAKFVPVDGVSSQECGFSVAVHSAAVAAGAIGDDANGAYTGAVYLFDAATGMQSNKLLAQDGEAHDTLGYATALDAGFVASSAWGVDGVGAAYVFDRESGDQLTRLFPRDGEVGEEFGSAIAIRDGLVVVGAHMDDVVARDSGSAYLFDARSGAQLAKLVPGDAAAGDEFGFAVAIHDDVVAVGSHRSDVNGVDSGAVYLFDAATGTQLAKLTPADGRSGAEFGCSVAMDEALVAVGARRHDGRGTAYLFDVTTGTQIATLLPSDGATNDRFGVTTALWDGIVAVGADSDDDNGANSGAAYLFRAPGAACPADLDENGVVDVQDFFLYWEAWIGGDPIADWNGDRVINSLDFLEYLNSWASGC